MRILSREVSWPLFLAMARRHRVEGLAANAIRLAGLAIPPAVAEALKSAALRIAADGLASAAECARLNARLSTASVPHIFVKGATLGRLSYGNPFVKMSWDIDLLVAPSDVSRAAEALCNAGYQAIVPGRGERGFIRQWHRTNKESVWRHAAAGHMVELHSRLSDNRRLIPEIDARSPSQSVDVAPGINLPTLATDELFAYLAVHGASSSWFRLKWLADFAGLAEAVGPAELARLERRATELGAGRCASVALALCREVFGSPIVEDSAPLSPVERWLVRTSLAYLAGPQSMSEPTDRRFGTLPLHLSHMMASKGWHYPITEVSRKVVEQFSRRRYS